MLINQTFFKPTVHVIWSGCCGEHRGMYVVDVLQLVGDVGRTQITVAEPKCELPKEDVNVISEEGQLLPAAEVCQGLWRSGFELSLKGSIDRFM